MVFFSFWLSHWKRGGPFPELKSMSPSITAWTSSSRADGSARRSRPRRLGVQADRKRRLPYVTSKLMGTVTVRAPSAMITDPVQPPVMLNLSVAS